MDYGTRYSARTLPCASTSVTVSPEDHTGSFRPQYSAPTEGTPDPVYTLSCPPGCRIYTGKVKICPCSSFSCQPVKTITPPPCTVRSTRSVAKSPTPITAWITTCGAWVGVI